MLTLFDPAAVTAAAWYDMFTLDETVTLAEKILRPVLVYAALIVMVRLFGKRELAQLNPFDLIVILSLSNTVQNAMIGPDNSLVGGIIGAASLLAVNYLVARWKWSSPTVEAITEGTPAVLIENGKANESAMRSELITRHDLDIIAHQHGLDDAADIDKLVLDPNGTFLVDGKDEVKEAKFKRETLKKLDQLSRQIERLNLALSK
jgi:uncharacterized membrane protein YcaP (DUF421 family)